MKSIATIKYAILVEIFFSLICAFLAAVEYYMGEGNLTVKGVIACWLVFQVLVAIVVYRFWSRLRDDTYSDI